ncbi:MAG: DUF393 domain-containing protein [Deltaproteobacteria bacterium]|nr:DUF393 domain-containing protein [Deltaproteobacteria bacterium]
MPEKPVLYFDDMCHLCRCSVQRWQRATGNRIDYLPSPTRLEAVQLVESDGKIYNGAEAVFRVLSYAPGWKRNFLKSYERFYIFATTSEWFYRVVARHRKLFSKLIRCPSEERH